ncbi:MAG: TlpA disulfide reductase family protein [Terracidiphilus sp.]
MRHTRIFFPLVLLSLALSTACDRGAHPVQVGRRAPDFTVSDGTSTIHLASYRGQVVLLNFWWSQCAPCIQELPSLEALHHDEPGVVMLAVSVDEDPEEYTTFLARRHVDLITVRDPTKSVATLFHTEGWPETYLIDRQGIIRRKFIGAQDWESAEIRAFLKSL